VRSVVLAGAGKGFCAGADVTEWSEAVDGGDDTGLRWERNAHALVQELHDLPKPTVAVLQGAAVGAGLDLACACDFRVASEDAVFFCAYTWVGYNPDAGGTWLYPRLLGLEAAKRFVFTGERWDAATAEARGLVSEVVPGDELAAAGARLAAELATGPSVAIGLAKGLLQTSSTRTLGEQLEAEKAAGKICAETEDHKEALAAFAEKRSPVFRGR
jgi:2-(1,2-epoxy-1,2-dihydrophenyl)acetyl-CoA isomerase